MAELRIPREEERKEIEEHFECVKKECIHAEALIVVNYNFFQEIRNIRVRCTKSNLILSPQNKICSSFENRELV